MAKNETVIVKFSTEERELLEKLKSKFACSYSALFFSAILKAYPSEIQESEKINLDDIRTQNSIEKKYFIYKRYARRHHIVFVECMELTKKKINGNNLITNIINPNLEILKARNIPEGVHFMKELKHWIEEDYDSFVKYSNEFWHEKTTICDMIKRLEVNHFTGAVKYLDHLREEREGIKQVQKNMEG